MMSSELLSFILGLVVGFAIGFVVFGGRRDDRNGY